MSGDLPRLPSPSTDEVALAEQLTTEAERERRLARRYRRLGWVAASIALSSAPFCIVGVTSGILVKQDSALAFGLILLLQAIVAPVAALILFGTASRHSRRAARCMEAARPVTGATDLLADAESCRRASRRLRWLWPVVIVWGLLATATLLVYKLGLFVIVEPAHWLSLRIATLRRRAALMTECARLGFSYREEPLKVLLAPFSSLPLFRRGGKATHLMEGHLAGRAVRIMDYAIPLDEHTEKRQTVVVVGLNSSRAVFRLWRTSPAAASVPSHIEAILTGEVTTFLNKLPGLAVEVEDGLLAVYEPGFVWEPADYPRLLAAALTLCDRLDAALARQDKGE